MEQVDIEYTFFVGKDLFSTFRYEIDPVRLEIMNATPTKLPAWTDLAFMQCSICPFQAGEKSYCPLSVRLIDIVHGFHDLTSHDTLFVRVRTAEREVSQTTSAQRAISSLLGLVMATSGCPHTAFFKPMARFHLPLSSEAETIFRATGSYLLAQYFRHRSGKTPDLDLTGLSAIYERVHVINKAVADRIRAAVKTDSSINAIILLDLYTKTFPDIIEESLEEIKYLYAAYLGE